MCVVALRSDIWQKNLDILHICTLGSLGNCCPKTQVRSPSRSEENPIFESHPPELLIFFKTFNNNLNFMMVNLKIL